MEETKAEIWTRPSTYTIVELLDQAISEADISMVSFMSQLYLLFFFLHKPVWRGFLSSAKTKRVPSSTQSDLSPRRKRVP